jgi:hypothetical protein
VKSKSKGDAPSWKWRTGSTHNPLSSACPGPVSSPLRPAGVLALRQPSFAATPHSHSTHPRRFGFNGSTRLLLPLLLPLLLEQPALCEALPRHGFPVPHLHPSAPICTHARASAAQAAVADARRSCICG